MPRRPTTNRWLRPSPMNRYSRYPIVIADPHIGLLRINGMLRTENVIGFLGALQTTLPVDVRTDDRGRIMITGATTDDLPGS